MARPAHFRLNRSGLMLALISAAFAGQVHAAAGRVEFAMGAANVVGADGRTRPAARGTQLDTGDVVRTSDGRVQVRMTDGAFISLQPNTEFGIKDYKFQGKTDGSENAFFSLVKGAMRMVTGAVGRVNRNKFQVATPTATVGIRGTGGLIQVLNDGATLVQGTSGIWFLANPAGSIDIPAGVAGIAPVDPKQPPKETVQIPTAGPSPLPPDLYVQGDQRTGSGENVLTGGVLVSGGGFAAALAYGVDTCGDFCFQPNVNSGTGTAIFNGAGQMTQIDLSARAAALYTLEPGGTQVDFGTDGILAWGRWIGTVSAPGSLVGENYTIDQGLHYVVGTPTPMMPALGTATYTLIGATQPTYLDGSSAPGSFSGILSVNFGQQVVGMNLNVAMPNGNGYAIGGSAQITSGTAFFSGQTGSGLTVGGTSGSACASVCSARVDGFFAGTSAERAGLAYHIQDTFLDVLGAAAFTKQ